MEIIENYTEPMPSYNLLYLAKPVYGGWVTYTAHLSKKTSSPIHKVTKRTERSKRDYGYDCEYQNLSLQDAISLPNPFITAVDKHHWPLLQYFPSETRLVIHDPTEVKPSKNGNPLIQESNMGHKLLHNFKVITIRETVQKYLLDTHGIGSEYEPHPFYAYPKRDEGLGYRCVSIARIDFDKNTDIILEANALIKDPEKRVHLFGAENRLYVYHKLQDLQFQEYWHGKFPKTLDPSYGGKGILKDAQYMIDMSTIKGDGGGTQYTFLEAIHNDCVLVLHNEWIEKGDTFVSGVNCIGVSDKESLGHFLQTGLTAKKHREIVAKSKELLSLHLN